ncbi:MAG TPA: UDP-N-acetylmuramate dehydrogenase [Ktedonobacterales bacterium]|jgi:UDP-N-acetylmuramate dehydrogenase|nr:UDP-N-acetylmuramate dehydrogenase [Ktedonobacterales bacterium]
MREGEDVEAMLAALRERFGERARAGELLSRHGTFGVGGPADAWVTLNHEDELAMLVALAQAHEWPLMLVGNGTNVLFSDAGARGIIARMALDEWRLDDGDAAHTRLIAGAGVSLPKLVNELARRGLTGLEWGAGVPGTIGGAVVSNAGAHGACVADTLATARVLFVPTRPGDDAKIRELTAHELELGYRRSRFRAPREIVFDDEGRPSAAPRAPIEPREMITGATFQLRHADPTEVKDRVAAYRRHRKETQPPQPSAGSVFKNPPGDHSGRLIEAAGLKGHQLGRAQISPVHANFIVNRGGATAADVVALIALARRTVREQFGVELELEVELRGDW